MTSVKECLYVYPLLCHPMNVSREHNACKLCIICIENAYLLLFYIEYITLTNLICTSSNSVHIRMYLLYFRVPSSSLEDGLFINTLVFIYHAVYGILFTHCICSTVYVLYICSIHSTLYAVYTVYCTQSTLYIVRSIHSILYVVYTVYCT